MEEVPISEHRRLKKILNMNLKEEMKLLKGLSKKTRYYFKQR